MLLVALLAGCRHLVRDIDPIVEGAVAREASALVRVVIEIPAGTNAKWEVDKTTGRLVWERRGGRRRVVDYLAYPGSYGMVPRTLLPEAVGGDGDPLDVIVLGPALERGSVAVVRLIGVLELLDGGERDDKLIAVQPGRPLGDVESIAELERRYVGAARSIELWFANYKGVGVTQVTGFGGPVRAAEILDTALAAYAGPGRPPL